MKKVLCVSLLSCISIFCLAQETKVLSFMKDVNTFVSKVELSDSISNKQLKEYKEQMLKFDNLYDSIYSKEMNNKQIEIYSSYKSRYHKRISMVKTEKVTNKIDSVSQNIDNKIQKGTSKFIGTLKGIFSEQK